MPMITLVAMAMAMAIITALMVDFLLIKAHIVDPTLPLKVIMDPIMALLPTVILLMVSIAHRILSTNTRHILTSIVLTALDLLVLKLAVDH